MLRAAGLSLALLACPLAAAQAYPPTMEETGGPAPAWGAPPFCGHPRATRPPAIAPASPLRSVEQLPPQAVEVSLETPRFFYVHEGIFSPAAVIVLWWCPPLSAQRPIRPPPPLLPCRSPVDSVIMTVHLAAGGTGTVVLKRHERGWIGPKGELYERLPSEQQLAPYYR